jgi:hypothetical protein
VVEMYKQFLEEQTEYEDVEEADATEIKWG